MGGFNQRSRCWLPSEELKQIAWNDSCLSTDRLQAIIGQLEVLAVLYQRLTGVYVLIPHPMRTAFLT